jgi:RNA polymerase sigma-54 factor
MALELRLQQKLTQQLIMTPQLQMAIKLLQLSRLELVDAIRQELDENPTLEEVVDVSLDDQPDQAETIIDETCPGQRVNH